MNTENSKNFQINCKLYKSVLLDNLNNDYPLAYICSMRQFPVLREMHFCNAILNYKIIGYSQTVYCPNDSPRFDRRIWQDHYSRSQPNPYLHRTSLVFSITKVAVEPWKPGIPRIKDEWEPKLVIDTTNLRLYNNDWKLIPNTNRTFDVNIEGFLDDYKTDFFKDMFNALMEIQRIYAVK